MAEAMTVSAEIDEAVWGARADGVAALERELARLRRSTGAHAKEQGVIIARASVLNLVIFATREVHARRAARTIDELATRHPSRAIVVVGDRKRDGVAPDLEMHCHLAKPADLQQVSYEQILIRARGDADQRLASALIPLLLPDLPVFLWWTETPPLDRPYFDELLALADRLIVDSSDFARPATTLPRLHAVARSGHGRYGLTDFNWTRITPWRELISQFFDVPAWRPFLDGITGIRIGFSVDADGREIHPSQALLLIGWLASRLGWTAVESLAPSEAGGLLFAMRGGDGNEIQTRVRPRYMRGIDEGNLSGLRIQADAGQRHAEFVVKRVEDSSHATTTVRIDGVLVAERLVPLGKPGVGELLGEELTIARSDEIYEDALAALVALS
jgi:glucose-6-phosphate dehydrogenase assembly protein OpcA